MAKKDLQGRDNWQTESGPGGKAGVAEQNLISVFKEAFKDTDTYVYTIGDSVRARRIMEGTMEGRAVLNVLESQGFLHLEPLE